MDIKRKLALATATLAVAFGAGHLVQSGSGPGGAPQVTTASTLPRAITPLVGTVAPGVTPVTTTPTPGASADPVPDARVTPATLVATPDKPTPTPSTLPVAPPVSAAAPDTPVEPARFAPSAPVTVPPVTVPPETVLAETVLPVTVPPVAAEPAPARATPTAADICPVTLDVIAAPGAMLDIMLIAPCAGNSRIVLRHGGLAVTARTSASGTVFVTMPALEEDGAVAVLFPDATTATDATPVDLSGVARFAVQWMDDETFELHAYEDGAAYGAPGHVHAAAPVAEGALIALGDGTVDLPMRAEVYTFPRNGLPVEISVEAPVSDAACGREILGELLESRGGIVTPTEVTLAMPGCDAVGDVLVLNNLLPGTTLAQAE